MLVERWAFERDECLLVRLALLDSVVMMRRCRRSSGSTLALKRSHSSYHTVNLNHTPSKGKKVVADGLLNTLKSSGLEC